MKINQFESEERRKDDPLGDRPWRKHATPLNKPPSDPKYPTTPFNHDEWMKSSKPMEEGPDIPVPGDVIRTTKSEGKVSKVENGYVYFTTADGRNLRNTVANCLVVERLADQECNMCEDEIIDEVSTELLTKYKTAASKDASAADKSGDYARGNKRFSGIVKATKKQFDNDSKKTTVKENNRADLDLIWRKVESVVSEIWPDGDPIDWLMPWAKKHGIDYSMFDVAAQAYGYTDVYDYYNSMADLGEGTMGGINRSAPSNVVSYEKVLDEVRGKWNEEQVNELSIQGLKSYSAAAGRDIHADTRDAENARNMSVDKQIHGNFRGSGSWRDEADWLSNRAERRAGNVARATTKIAAKNSRLGEDNLNELSVDKLQAYKDAAKSPASFRTRPLRKLARTVHGVGLANQRINTKTGHERPDAGPERGNNESVDTNEVYQGPHLGDPEKLAKAPKSYMQGKDDVRFSELVQDTIQAFGVKDAFEFYVKKHGLPPRQFQIYAGLAVKPKAKARVKPDWTDPSTTNRPAKPQSWWQKLSSKLPFEE